MLDLLIRLPAWLVLAMALMGLWITLKHLWSLACVMFTDRTGNSGRSGSGHWWDGKEHD